MVTLNKRQIEMVNFLKKRDEYITISEISKDFDVSVRTVRNDLDSLKEALRNYNIYLETKPRVGVKLILDEGQSIHKVLNEYKIFSPEDRAMIIFLILVIKGKTTLEGLAEDIEVSKNTLVQDFKMAVSKLEEYDIKVSKKSFQGIWLNDSEEKIRNTFLNLYRQVIASKNNNVFKILVRDSSISNIQVRSFIEMLEERNHIRYSEESLDELETVIHLVFCRINNGFIITYDKGLIRNVKGGREFLILKETLEEVSKKNIINDEIYYLLKIFKGAKRTIDKVHNEEIDEGNIYSITTEILKDICEVINIDYSLDEEFIKQVVMHLKVAVYRIKNNLTINNPMLEEIKYKMSFIYSLTEKILNSKKHIMGVQFPEGEIAYMAMYFDALFEKSIKSKFSSKVLVVCNGGLATSSLLKARINVMIPEAEIINVCSIRDVTRTLNSYDIDLIVTTISLRIDGYKVIQVNPLLEFGDSEKIKAEIYNKRYEKNCKYLIEKFKVDDKSIITQLLLERYTQLDIDIKEWKDAIELATKPLITNRKIKKEYVNEIFRSIEILGNYMVFIPEIAFVHATAEHVIENSISLLTLKSSIKFGSKNQVMVKAIVVLANKEENMNLVNLINILTKEGNINRFKNAKNYKEIENII